MSIGASPRLRKLALMPGSPFSDDLFEAARRHEPVRPVRVGLDTRSMSLASEREQVMLRELMPLGRPPAIEVLPGPGEMPEWLAAGPASFRVQLNADGKHEAYQSTDEFERWTYLPRIQTWQWLAAQEFEGDPGRLEQLIEIEGLREIGADLVISADPAILRLRDHNLLRGLNVMTVDEASVVVGVWSRIIHKAFVAGRLGVNTGLFHWSFARALTPAAWPGFAAAHRLAVESADDGDVAELAGSVLDRLTSISRALDRLYATWQCKANNDTTAELVDEFDRLVLGSWAIYDNLVLMVGRHLRIDLPSPKEWGIRNRKWRRAVRSVGDPRGAAVIDYIESEDGYLAATEEMRHQLVHRGRLTSMSTRSGRESDVLIVIGGRTLANVERFLGEVGVAPEDWGVRHILEEGPLTVVNVNDPDGAREVHQGRQALVDPTAFALRVVAHAAHLGDGVFERLDIASDPRLKDVPRFQRPGDPYFSQTGAAMAVALSPLSGLVDWIPDVSLTAADPSRMARGSK